MADEKQAIYFTWPNMDIYDTNMVSSKIGIMMTHF